MDAKQRTIFSFTAERDLELSASLGQLGNYPFNVQTETKAAGSLSEGKRDWEHRQDVFRDAASKKRLREDIQQWRSRKTVKILVKKRAKDNLLAFLDKILHQKHETDVEQWLARFGDAGSRRLVDIVEELGIVELKRLSQTGTIVSDELGRIVQVTNKPVEHAKSLQVWFHSLNLLCDRKIAPSRVAWLFKTLNLLNDRKREGGGDLRIAMFPRATADLLVNWIKFTVSELTRANAPQSQRRGPPGKPQQQQPPSDTSGADLKLRVDRWRRQASVLRWAFEEGILRSGVVFQELLNLARFVFGLPPITSGANGVTAPNGYGRQSPVNHPGVSASSSVKHASNSVQVMVMTEVLSYTSDALKMGMGSEFYMCFVQLLEVPVVQQSSTLSELLMTAMRLCSKSQDLYEVEEIVGRDNYVRLAWTLENLKSELRDERTPLCSFLGPVQRLGGFNSNVRLCVAMLEWVCCSQVENDDQDEQALNAYLVSLALEEAEVNIRHVFDLFLMKRLANDENKDGEDDDSSITRAAQVLCQLLLRGVPVCLETEQNGCGLPQHRQQMNHHPHVQLKARIAQAFIRVLGRTDFANQGVRNAVGLKHHPTMEAVEFMDALMQCDFEMESAKLHERLFALSLPSLQVRVLIWLFANVSPCTMNLALVPFIRTCTPLRHALSRLTRSLSKASSLQRQSPGLFDETSLLHQLRDAIQERISTMSELESARLRELVTDPGAAGNGHSSSSQGSTESVHQPPPSTTAFTKPSRTRPSNSLVLAGILPSVEPTPASVPTTSQQQLSSTQSSSQSSSQGSNSGETNKSSRLTLGLNVAGYEGERVRYEEGLRMMNDRVEKLATAAKAIYTEFKQEEPSTVPVVPFAVVLSDLMCCRPSADRLQLSGWCLKTLDLSEEEMLLHVIDSGLCSVEDLVTTRSIVPTAAALWLCTLKSRTFRHQLRNHSSAVVRFALSLFSQSTAASSTYQGFLKFFADTWIAKGESILELPENQRDLIRLVTAFLSDDEGQNGPAETRSIDLSSWSIARRGWFVLPQRSSTAALAQWALETCASCDPAAAAVVASVVVAWFGGFEVCNQARPMICSSKTLSPSLVALVSRCLAWRPLAPASSMSSSATSSLSYCKQFPYRQQQVEYIQSVTTELKSASLSEHQQESLLVILCACLRNRTIGMPAVPEPPLIDPEPAMQLLMRINPVIYKQLTIDLLQFCVSTQRHVIVALLDVWKIKWPEEVHFFALVHRVITENVGAFNKDAVPIENLIRAGDVCMSIDEARYVDAWTVVEGAKESNANCEFLRNAIIRQTQNS